MSIFITKAFRVALLPLLHLAGFDHDVVVVTFAVHFDLSKSKDLRFHGASGSSDTINHAREVTLEPLAHDLRCGLERVFGICIDAGHANIDGGPVPGVVGPENGTDLISLFPVSVSQRPYGAGNGNPTPISKRKRRRN